MSNIYFNAYLRKDDFCFRIEESVTLEDFAAVLSSFFENEKNWYRMRECWLENGRSEEFRHLMKEALLDFCMNDLA